MNNNDSEKDIKDKIVALLFLFQGKPNLLANYLLHYDVLKKDFKNKLIDNKFLKDISDDIQDSGIIIKPYFTTIESMQEYYNRAFHECRTNTNVNNQVLKSGNDEQALLLQLINAVEEEDFEKASKIKIYMEELGYSSNLY